MKEVTLISFAILILRAILYENHLLYFQEESWVLIFSLYQISLCDTKYQYDFDDFDEYLKLLS